MIHVVEVQKVRPTEEEGRMSNLLGPGRLEPPDELAALRREALEADARTESEGRSKKEKSKKKDKKDKEKDKKRKKKDRSRSPDRKRGERDLEEILGNSGLDPNPRKRAKYLKKARKLVKKKKKKKESGSGTEGTENSGTGSTDSSIGLDPEEVFGQTKLAKKIWKKSPGVLTAMSLGAVQEQLLTGQGQLWDLDRQSFLRFSCSFIELTSMGACLRWWGEKLCI